MAEGGDVEGERGGEEGFEEVFDEDCNRVSNVI